MKKNWFLFISATVLMVIMLSACGSTTKTTDQSSSAPAASETKKADKAAQPSTTAKTTDTSKTAANTAATGKVEDIKVEATDFKFDKKEIHVKKGDKVKITLHSDDGGHGFAIPAYNVDIQGNKSAEFTADKAGTYEYHCSLYCGSGHSQMTGKLIVE